MLILERHHPGVLRAVPSSTLRGKYLMSNYHVMSGKRQYGSTLQLQAVVGADSTADNHRTHLMYTLSSRTLFLDVYILLTIFAWR